MLASIRSGQATLTGTNHAADPLNPDDFERAKLVTENKTNPIELARLLENDIKLPNTRNGVRAEQFRWPGGEVIYEIGREYNTQERAIISKAISIYRDQTCIRFKQRQNHHKAYISIFKGSGCYSYVGRQGRSQEVSLPNYCLSNIGTVIHEFMHAVGFWHEQQRYDRDNYITVRRENIQPDCYNKNFAKKSLTEITHRGTKYDLCSVMHYGLYDCSKNDRKTIVPKVPLRGCSQIGYQSTFSPNDVIKIDKLYQHECRHRQRSASCVEDTNMENRHPKCDNWASVGHCKKYPDYMDDFCAKACSHQCTMGRDNKKV